MLKFEGCQAIDVQHSHKRRRAGKPDILFGKKLNVAEPLDITAILEGACAGNQAELDRLLPAVYDELRSLAERHLRHERRDHTLQPTALANEAYLKLTRHTGVSWRNRIHFFGAAGQAIRRILIDHARARRRLKRFGQRVSLEFESLAGLSEPSAAGLSALDEALTRLTAEAPRKARVVELRYFSGLTAEETAELLGVTTRTVERDWRYARAWLYRELADEFRGGEVWP